MKIRAFLLYFICSIFINNPAQATSVLLMGLDQLQQDAAYIFRAQCLSNNETEDQATGLPVTYTTFSVLDKLKGSLGHTYTIKQFGNTLAKGGEIHISPGTPKFEIGKEYFVFLPQPSHLGFSSPIGLTQGTFSLKKDKDGLISVTNGRNFSEMLSNVPDYGFSNATVLRKATRKLPTTPGSINESSDKTMPLDEFVSIIKAMGGNHE